MNSQSSPEVLQAAPTVSSSAAPSGVAVSFVVPAYNEERFIGSTLRSICEAVADALAFELIVVDNGSSDRTVEIARAEGARVLVKKEGTIGALRNLGAGSAKGSVLVFMDADVTLDSSWRDSFVSLAAQLKEDSYILSGSALSIPAGATWLERWWFGERAKGDLSYIGSAHLIVERERFYAVGGFDESLTTGEDYDFCSRMVSSGAVIAPLPRGVAEHHGYPKDLTTFFRREVWHGLGDYKSISTALDSRVALAVLLFIGCHLVVVIGIAIQNNSALIAGVASVLALCTAASWSAIKKWRLRALLINSGIYYLYFAARAASLFFVLFALEDRIRSPRVQSAGD